jgi:hypothetical protein
LLPAAGAILHLNVDKRKDRNLLPESTVELASTCWFCHVMKTLMILKPNWIKLCYLAQEDLPMFDGTIYFLTIQHRQETASMFEQFLCLY